MCVCTDAHAAQPLEQQSAWACLDEAAAATLTPTRTNAKVGPRVEHIQLQTFPFTLW